jgi:signal transduction histidine kinase/ligand-binding sensor domain-containing protein
VVRTFLVHHVWRRLPIVAAALSLLLWSSAALALDPSKDVSKYGHTVWRNLDGFGPGTIGPIAQTTDGYLWLGTPNGLLRFDGVRSVPWRPPTGSALPDDRVRTLLGTRDGALWVGTFRGLASWKDGKLFALLALKGRTINALTEDAEGTVWVGGLDGDKGFVCAVRKAADSCQAIEGPTSGAIAALVLDSKGDLWAAAGDRVWRAHPASAQAFRLNKRIGALQTMAATPDGGIAVATSEDVMKVHHGNAEPIALPALAQGLQFTKLLCDRDGGLWIAAADFGLLHTHDGRTDVYTGSDGLSGDHVLGLFEDREGNIWASTSHGLDRFRAMAAAIYSRGDGVKGRVASVLTAHDGSLWATTTVGVYRLDKGTVSEVRRSRSATLFQERKGRIWLASQYDFGYFEGGTFTAPPQLPRGTIDGIAETSTGDIWFAYRDEGLLRLRSDGSVERTAWAALGKRGAVSTMVLDPSDDSLWLGTWSGSVMNVHQGKTRSFLQLREPSAGSGSAVTQLRLEADGSLWVASRSSLTWIKHGRANRLDLASGMPCEGAYWTLEDERSTWIYTSCGLVQVARAEMDVWRTAMVSGVTRRIKVRLLDQAQGVGQPSNVSAVGQLERVQLFTPKAARTPDGRIWFVTGDGIAAVDPAHILSNNVAPPVHVEQIVADGTVHEARTQLRLPPLRRDLRIDYTALSFTAPEQVRFRYRLEGRDTGWQDAGNRRQAFYTDLAPGHYTFRVIAANDSEVWNETGDALAFTVEPAWWQSIPFRITCLLVVLLLGYGLYRLRITQMARRLSISFDARVNERLHIARDLHDTLLQSFQGHVLRLQTALQLWPNADARRILEEGIDQASDAITEGRNAVQGLRAAAIESSDLAEAVRALGQVLATDPSLPAAKFGVEVQGRPLTLHPVVRDDVFRIVGEALRNAFRHAEPKHVEVDIRYDDRELSVLVRDDGKGIDRSVVRRGREGHFGLHGMRERARLIGGKLSFRSRREAGTEVALIVPAARAYAAVAFTGQPEDAVET